MLPRSLTSTTIAQFFEDEDGIIAVFDFDYETIIDFDCKVATCGYIMAPFAFVLGMLCLDPCFRKKNIEWDTYAKHVAVHQVRLYSL